MVKGSSNRLIRKAIREILEPAIAEFGFTGKYPDWRRELGGETHFLSIHTRKYGGGFGVTGAWRKTVPYTESATYSLPAEQTELAHTDFDNRASLVRIKQAGIIATCTMAWRTVGDFDYAHILGDEAACRDLVEEAEELLPALDHWLKTREPGLGIDTKGHRMRQMQTEQISWHFAAAAAGQFALGNRVPETPFRTQNALANLAPEYPA